MVQNSYILIFSVHTDIFKEFVKSSKKKKTKKKVEQKKTCRSTLGSIITMPMHY